MGRARKRGMDYFPVDVNLMDSTEIKVLTAKFGTFFVHTAGSRDFTCICS